MANWLHTWKTVKLGMDYENEEKEDSDLESFGD